MPAPRYRSRSLRRIYRKTPGGRTVLRYEKRKPSKARCGSCGVVLKGMLRGRVYRMKKAVKTKKRPERPYGGVLCGRCLKRKIIEGARK